MDEPAETLSSETLWAWNLILEGRLRPGRTDLLATDERRRIVQSMPVEARLAGLSAAERLAGLTLDEIPKVLAPAQQAAFAELHRRASAE